MPLCTLHLVSLHDKTPNSILTFLSTSKSAKLSPLVVSRVIRWIILPSKLSTEHLLARNIQWDLLIVVPRTGALPTEVQKLVRHQWSVTAGVPSRLVQDFSTKNDQLLHADKSTLPAIQEKNNKTTDSSQSLELSDELNEWIKTFVNTGSKAGKGAVSMFNLLAFNPGMKEEYLKYGAAFAKSIGSKHGGNAKIVGNVTHVNGSMITKAETGTGMNVKVDGGVANWDEIALAHYPSILHFRNMLASEDYQEVNQRHRLPSLRDTCILMTSEIAVEELLSEVKGGAKL
ncbi:Cell division control 45 like [Pyrenophora seminiperda CCB06]|uniref:Cell division control 45 like n=1 Tax=Pyrenophora seminiperda CCB06 TaxID=1302712 RepID=A0A3M7M8P8_9PLEO|nr:Cell division control 45 like [Pyrenophora seminiperda CCB06]